MTDFTGDAGSLRKKPRYEHQEYPMMVAHPDPSQKSVLCKTRAERLDFYRSQTAEGKKEIEERKVAEKIKNDEEVALELEMATMQRKAMEAAKHEALSDLEKAKNAAEKSASKALTDEMDGLKKDAEKASKPSKSKKTENVEAVKFE